MGDRPSEYFCVDLFTSYRTGIYMIHAVLYDTVNVKRALVKRALAAFKYYSSMQQECKSKRVRAQASYQPVLAYTTPAAQHVDYILLYRDSSNVEALFFFNHVCSRAQLASTGMIRGFILSDVLDKLRSPPPPSPGTCFHHCRA